MTFQLRIGGYQPERSVHTRAVRTLERVVAERSGGTLFTAFTPEIMKTGRAAADLLAMTEKGELEICYFASSYLSARVTALTVLDLPFPGTDRASIWRRLDGEAGRLIRAAVAAATGYEVLAFWDNGIRHISNGAGAITKPADCAGLSIRTLDSAFHQAMFSAMGFRPRYIDVKDLAAEVRARTIDAQENPLTNIVNFDIHKTHGHVTLLGQFFGIALLLGNRTALARLSTADRAAVDGAVAAATADQRRFAAEEDAACLALLQAEGVSVVMPEAIDFRAFQAAVAPVVAAETARLDKALLAAWRGRAVVSLCRRAISAGACRDLPVLNRDDE